MVFGIAVEMKYNGKTVHGTMGPFQHSAEREFAMTVNRRAIDNCSDLSQLKTASKQLLEGWASMQTAFQTIMLENMQLRQTLAKQELDLRAADEILNEAAETVQQYAPQPKKAKRFLWPW